MTAAEAIEYIEKGIWSTTRLGLERTYELLELLGNPQKKLKIIHVAGSNGKGSTCAHFQSDFFVGCPFRIAADGGQRFKDLGGGRAGVAGYQSASRLVQATGHRLVA